MKDRVSGAENFWKQYPPLGLNKLKVFTETTIKRLRARNDWYEHFEHLEIGARLYVGISPESPHFESTNRQTSNKDPGPQELKIATESTDSTYNYLLKQWNYRTQKFQLVARFTAFPPIFSTEHVNRVDHYLINVFEAIKTSCYVNIARRHFRKTSQKPKIPVIRRSNASAQSTFLVIA